MIDHAEIAALIPHQGAMCLLDTVQSWSDTRIACHASSHLSEDNPLRRSGRLDIVCGCEYGFQAAALHGALRAGGVAQPAGYVAGLRISVIACQRLDDARLGLLGIQAWLEFAEETGLIYGFDLRSEAGRVLLEGRGTIKLPPLAGFAR